MSQPFTSAHRLVADPLYPSLKAYLIGATGLAYYTDKDSELATRVSQRLAELGLGDCGSYLALLKEGPRGETELDRLIEDLTIGETFFFRHRELFEALRDIVFPDLIARNQSSRHLRIWSAGCSTGAEPYSLNILLRRDLAARVAGWDITIVGTDINRDFLARAREGRFEEWALRSSQDELKRTCFLSAGRSWLLKPEFKEGVSFQYHNLVAHPFPSLLNNLFAFDLILCRNVTIYFNLDIVRRIIGHFHQSLVEGGWLLVGHSEPNMELFRDFRTVNAPGAVLYQKSQAASILPTWTPAPIPMAKPPTSSPGPVSGFVPTWQPPNLDWGIAPGLEKSAGSSTAGFPPPAPPLAPQPPRELEAIRSLADRGEWEQAAQCCRQVLEKDKLNPTVHFLHALILEQTGRHAEAEQSLRRSLYLDRTFVLAHYYLGLLLQRQRQLPQAARSFQNVLQLLARLDPGKVFADGDGITAGELTKLTQMHLKVLEGA